MSLLEWVADGGSNSTYEGALGISPWDIPSDLGGPRRGSLEDYGGARLVDEDPSPPRTGEELYADLCNGLQKAAATHDRVVIALGISVTLDLGGAPALSQCVAPGEDITVSDLTLTATATGDVTISWPDRMLPPSALGPQATLNDLSVGGGAVASMLSSGLGVRVKTWDGTNTLVNRPFTVTVR